MANLLHGPYQKGASTTNGPWGTGVGQTNSYVSGNANNAETQSAVALYSINPDLIGAGFVLNGVTCAKDGTTASQLDVASGYAYLIQSDGTNARCDVASTTFSSSGHAASTLYLDLNPDGSWSWGTSHSAVANHLTICSVTTDGSSNISAVTDARNLNPALLSALSGVFTHLLAKELSAKTALGGSTQTLLELWATDNHYWAVQQDTSGDLLFLDSTGGHTWTFGGSGVTLFPGGVIIGAGEAITGAITSLGGQASAGSFGAPVIVAQTVNQHVTTTTQTNILSWTPTATGLYRVSGIFYMNNGSGSEKVLVNIAYQDATTNTAQYVFGNGSVGATAYVYAGGLMSGPIPTGYGTIDSVVIYAQSGTAIVISWQDILGTPNDYISVVLERLS